MNSNDVFPLCPKEYIKETESFLKNRYGEKEAVRIMKETEKYYESNLKDLPDVGGEKNGHAKAVYGGLFVFSLYPALPDQPEISELQDFVSHLFMGPFIRLGKIFNLNRNFDIRLIDLVFRLTAAKDQKVYEKYPESFCNVYDGFDNKQKSTRYHFTKCPNAEFAKKHGLLHILPLLCNCDYFGISEIHGQLIRKGTCGFGDCCDYLIVGDENPLAEEYETAVNEYGSVVSRRKEKE